MLGSPSKSCSHTPSRRSRFDSHARRAATQQVLQHGELARGQADLGVGRASSGGAPGSRRRSPASRTRVGSPCDARRSRARSAGDQDGERERLGQEVVGAGVERLGLVRASSSLAVRTRIGVQSPRRRGASRRPRNPFATRQHQVEDDRGRSGARGARHSPSSPSRGDVDREPLGLQPAPDGRRRSARSSSTSKIFTARPFRSGSWDVRPPCGSGLSAHRNLAGS